MSRSGCRLAVLASHPIQYFTPLYRLLAQVPSIDIEVMFCRDFGVKPSYDKQFGTTFSWDTDQLSGYRHRFLANVSPIRDTFNPLHAINPGAFFRLLRGFDAVWLNGYTYPSNWLALFASKIGGAAILYRSDFRLDELRARKATDGIRDQLVRWWVRRSDALLYIGAANKEAYQHYGASPSQLFFTPFSVDVERIATVRAEVHRNRDAVRDSWQIPSNKCVVLFAGKLTPGKHPEALLSIASSPRLSASVHVVFAGSGPLEAALRQRVQEERLTNVTFLGFINQQRLPEIYALSDVFVMPAEREAWGLAVNEAMAAGAVPVVSTEMGATRDLVSDGTIGYAVPPGDTTALHEALWELVSSPELRARMSSAAITRSSEYSFRETVQGILSALSSLGLLSAQAVAA